MFRIFRRKKNTAAYVPEGNVVKRGRRVRVFLFISLVAIFFTAVAVGWFVFHSPFFRVKNIEILGNKSVSDDAILSLAMSFAIGGDYFKALLGTDHYFNWEPSILDGALYYLPGLKNIEVERDFRDAVVTIRVEERKPVGIWCFMTQDTKCYWFDEDGVIFRPAPFAQGGLINTVSDHSQSGVGLGGVVLREDLISALFSVFSVLGDSGLAVKNVSLNNLKLEELSASIFNGPEIYFSLRFPADNVLDVLESLISRKGFSGLEYVDFRVKNRVYYR